MRFRERRPPGIAPNFTFWMRGDLRGGAVGGGLIGLGWREASRVMAGTLPGMLLRVNRTCDRRFVFKMRLLVGLGAAMIGGAFVMRQRDEGVVTICSVGVVATLCSSGAVGVGSGDRCGSSSGSIHLWRGCVTTLLDGWVLWWAASLALSEVSTRHCLVAVIVFRVAIILLVNPCKCSPVVRHGTLQCCGNKSAESEMGYARIAGTK